MNSNTFQDQPGQTHRCKLSLLSHTDAVSRAPAIDNNMEYMGFCMKLGSKAVTIWVGDGSNFPGQSHFTPIGCFWYFTN